MGRNKIAASATAARAIPLAKRTILLVDRIRSESRHDSLRERVI